MRNIDGRYRPANSRPRVALRTCRVGSFGASCLRRVDRLVDAWPARPVRQAAPDPELPKFVVGFPDGFPQFVGISSAHPLHCVSVVGYQVGARGELCALLGGRFVDSEEGFFGEVPPFAALRHPQRPSFAGTGSAHRLDG